MIISISQGVPAVLRFCYISVSMGTAFEIILSKLVLLWQTRKLSTSKFCLMVWDIYILFGCKQWRYGAQMYKYIGHASQSTVLNKVIYFRNPNTGRMREYNNNFVFWGNLKEITECENTCLGDTESRVTNLSITHLHWLMRVPEGDLAKIRTYNCGVIHFLSYS